MSKISPRLSLFAIRLNTPNPHPSPLPMFPFSLSFFSVLVHCPKGTNIFVSLTNLLFSLINFVNLPLASSPTI